MRAVRITSARIPPPGGAVIYKPFLLDGSRSTNPDQGQTDGTPGAPPSTISVLPVGLLMLGSFYLGLGAQVDASTALDASRSMVQLSTFACRSRITIIWRSQPPVCPPVSPSMASAQVSIHNPTDESCTHCVQISAEAPRLRRPALPVTSSCTGRIRILPPRSPSITTMSIAARARLSSRFAEIAGANSSPFVAAVPAVSFRPVVEPYTSRMSMSSAARRTITASPRQLLTTPKPARVM